MLVPCTACHSVRERFKQALIRDASLPFCLASQNIIQQRLELSTLLLARRHLPIPGVALVALTVIRSSPILCTPYGRLPFLLPRLL